MSTRGTGAHSAEAWPWPDSGLDDWRRLVEKSLKGRSFESLRSRTRDGIAIEPLYLPVRDAEPLFARRGPWTIVQRIHSPDPDIANAEALTALAGGVGSLALVFDEPEAAQRGLPLSKVAVGLALEGVDLGKVAIRVEPHRDGTRIASWIAELVAARGYAPERVSIAFGLDPAASLPQVSADAETAFVEDALSLRHLRFNGSVAILDGRPFHEAGVTEAQELAAVLAAASWWLSAFDAAGVFLGDALPLLGVSLSVDQDVLVSVGKLRAMRLLWKRLAELCGAPDTPLALHAETSRRMLTAREPHNNLLRNTLAALAAAMGGAESLSVLPHVGATDDPAQDAAALARNTQHLLMRESDLHRVADPLAGSGSVESLTEALAAHAWSEFRTIEADGGLLPNLRGGPFAARIAAARASLEGDVAAAKPPIVGVTAHAAQGALSEPIALPSRLPGLEGIRLETFAGIAP